LNTLVAETLTYAWLGAGVARPEHMQAFVLASNSTQQHRTLGWCSGPASHLISWAQAECNVATEHMQALWRQLRAMQLVCVDWKGQASRYIKDLVRLP